MNRENGNQSGAEYKHSSPVRAIYGFFKDEAIGLQPNKIWEAINYSVYGNAGNQMQMDEDAKSALQLMEAIGNEDEKIKAAQLREILRFPAEKDASGTV